MPLFASPALLAQTMEGVWDFRIEGTTIFRFEIEEGEDGEWLGQWQKPESFNTDGTRFANLDGGVRSDASMTGIEFLGHVELSFDDPRPGAVPDIFRFEQTGDDAAQMVYVGTDLEPFTLVRAGESDVIGDWDGSRIYNRSNAGEQPAVLAEAEIAEEDEAAAEILVSPEGVPIQTLRQRGPQINFIDVNPLDDVSATPDLSGADGAQMARQAEASEASVEEQEPEAIEDVSAEEEEEQSPSLIGDDFLEGF